MNVVFTASTLDAREDLVIGQELFMGYERAYWTNRVNFMALPEERKKKCMMAYKFSLLDLVPDEDEGWKIIQMMYSDLCRGGFGCYHMSLILAIICYFSM